MERLTDDIEPAGMERQEGENLAGGATGSPDARSPVVGEPAGSTSSLPDVVAEGIAERETELARLRELAPCVTQVLAAAGSLAGYQTITVHPWNRAVIGLSFAVAGRTNIGSILRSMGGHGFRQCTPPLRPDERGERTYFLTHNNWPASLNLTIHAHFAFTGERCRMVQVGVREVPVMELRCDEEPVAIGGAA